MTIMETARAWRFTERGMPADVLHLETIPIPTLPPPLPLPKDVTTPEEWLIVRVSHTALNPGSQFLMNILPQFARARVSVPEMDFSGTVLDSWVPDTAAVQIFSKGDEVVGFIPSKHGYPTGTGALASHIRVPARYVVKKPRNASLEQSAGLLCAGCSAWTLINEADLKRGDRVLVVGASGGIGTKVVQLAKHIVGDSGVVVGVCSGRNGSMVRQLGADEVRVSLSMLLPLLRRVIGDGLPDLQRRLP
jgi:reticulon-4-interacting protein 1, mitochondrial